MKEKTIGQRYRNSNSPTPSLFCISYDIYRTFVEYFIPRYFRHPPHLASRANFLPVPSKTKLCGYTSTKGISQCLTLLFLVFCLSFQPLTTFGSARSAAIAGSRHPTKGESGRPGNRRFSTKIRWRLEARGVSRRKSISAACFVLPSNRARCSFGVSESPRCQVRLTSADVVTRSDVTAKTLERASRQGASTRRSANKPNGMATSLDKN